MTLFVFTLVLLTGCLPSLNAFHCEADQQCGAGGWCETVGLCSFVDSTCPSGRRFGHLAGASSDRCVAEQAGAIIDASIDAPLDAPPDAPPDAATCFGGSFLTVCMQQSPSAPLTVSSLSTIDTSSTAFCAPVTSTTRGGDYCVMAATSIAIDALLRAVGTRPLVLIARDSITIGASGMVDVGSHSNPTPQAGAGADPSECADTAQPGPTAANGTGGGGAGGTFGGMGGAGGPGGGTNGGAAGMGAFTLALLQLRGGCPGQAGAGGAGGAGGHGGGAVYLIAGNRIDVQGTISAGGAGGGGGAGNPSAGGGGGGAGGLIGFDAPVITASGQLLANGGSGGGGASSSPSPGSPGSDAVAIGPAAGGAGAPPNGGRGGDGSARSTTVIGARGSSGGGTGGGGGGGGGAAGMIKAPPSASLGSNVSPAPTP